MDDWKLDRPAIHLNNFDELLVLSDCFLRYAPAVSKIIDSPSIYVLMHCSHAQRIAISVHSFHPETTLGFQVVNLVLPTQQVFHKSCKSQTHLPIWRSAYAEFSASTLISSFHFTNSFSGVTNTPNSIPPNAAPSIKNTHQYH